MVDPLRLLAPGAGAGAMGVRLGGVLLPVEAELRGRDRFEVRDCDGVALGAPA